MAIFTTSDVKLEGLNWPFVARCELLLPRRGDVQVFPVAAMTWPNRFECRALSIKHAKDAAWSPGEVQVRLILSGGSTGSKAYLDLPVLGMAYDPFGFYTHYWQEKHKPFISPQQSVVIEVENVGNKPQTGLLLAKVDGMLYRDLNSDGRST